MGEEISLRLRTGNCPSPTAEIASHICSKRIQHSLSSFLTSTDDFEGFRHYSIIVKTVLHELAHMVHSEHDKHFHALNNQLNKVRLFCMPSFVYLMFGLYEPSCPC